MEAQEIISRNRSQQVQARALNTRAGEAIFTVMSREDIERFLKERLAGARRMAEVKNLAVIAFPELEQGMVDLVVGENPDEIIVLDKMLKVEYRDGYAPRVTLDRETISAHGWRELPDAGVKLPGGRLVEVVVSFGYYDTVSGKDIPELKSRCISRANKSLWDNWPSEGRPAIALPDPADQTSTVPEIIECQYGVSVIDGTALIAYGVVAVKGYRRYSSDPYFEGRWFHVREEAGTTRAKSAAKLEEIRKEAVEQKRLKDARQAAEASKEKLRAVNSYGLEHELRGRIDSRRYEYLPSSVEELHAWTKETEKLVAEAEAALKSMADKEAEEERVQREAESRRESIAEQIRNLPHGMARILVREDASVAVCCGKSSKMGDFYVSPSLGERQHGEASLDSQGKESTWEPIPVGQRVTVRDMSARGHVNWEISFTVPSDLTPGVWAVAEDEGRKIIFYPIFFHQNGREVIPVEVKVVKEMAKALAPKVAPANAKPATGEAVNAALAALQAKFGKKR